MTRRRPGRKGWRQDLDKPEPVAGNSPTQDCRLWQRLQARRFSELIPFPVGSNPRFSICFSRKAEHGLPGAVGVYDFDAELGPVSLREDGVCRHGANMPQR